MGDGGGEPDLHPLLSKRSIYLKEESANQKQHLWYIPKLKNQVTK